MPSKSKAQQRFMGMVHALNKGEMKPSDASPAVKKAAKSMDTKSSKKYASSTHKGKPEKVKKEWLVKTIKELTNTEMEACGYTTSAVDPKYKLKSPGGTGQEDKQLKEAYGLDEMKMALIDKEIKKKIKAVARKDRNAGIQLMNLYKKHWIEFMLKAKDLLSKESLSLVNPIRMKKPTKSLPDDSLTEAVNPKVKKQASALLKRYTNNWKKLEKETEMLMKFAKKSKANEMAMNFEEVLKKLKGSVWDNIRYQVEKPMDDFFYESVNIDEGKGVEKIMKMANDQSFGKLAGRTVDGMTAQLFKQVYDKAPQNAKDKINKMNEKQLYVFMGKLWSKFGRQVSLR